MDTINIADCKLKCSALNIIKCSFIVFCCTNNLQGLYISHCVIIHYGFHGFAIFLRRVAWKF